MKRNYFFGFLKLVFRVIYFARSLLKAIKYDVLVALLYIECYRSAWMFLIVLMKNLRMI